MTFGAQCASADALSLTTAGSNATFRTFVLKRPLSSTHGFSPTHYQLIWVVDPNLPLCLPRWHKLSCQVAQTLGFQIHSTSRLIVWIRSLATPFLRESFDTRLKSNFRRRSFLFFKADTGLIRLASTPELREFLSKLVKSSRYATSNVSIYMAAMTRGPVMQSVATDILIKYVSINHETHAKDLLKTISDKPTLSARVSTLRVRHSGAPTATQIELLERLSQLSDATIPVSQAAIEALVRSGSSKTLRKLALQSPYIIASPTEPLDISNFLVLEELVINYPHYMPYSTMKGKHLDKLPALPRLRRLHLSSAPRDIIFSLTEYRYVFHL